MIHKTAIVDTKSKISSNVKIGAYAVIDRNVSIGNGCIIKDHAVIRENTSVGNKNTIFQFATIGEQPQDLKFSGDTKHKMIGFKGYRNSFSRKFSCSIILSSP